MRPEIFLPGNGSKHYVELSQTTNTTHCTEALWYSAVKTSESVSLVVTGKVKLNTSYALHSAVEERLHIPSEL